MGKHQPEILVGPLQGRKQKLRSTLVGVIDIKNNPKNYPLIMIVSDLFLKVILLFIIFNYNEHQKGQAATLEKETIGSAKIERRGRLNRSSR